MYNLLVSGHKSAWSGEPFLIERSRCVSEFTDPDVSEQFAEMSAAEIRELCSLPCVFAYEIPCGKDPKLGVLRAVKRREPRKYLVEYEVIPCYPFLTAEGLLSLKVQLDIRDSELYRTHWAVKDVTLERELESVGVALPGSVIQLRSFVDIDNHHFAVALSFPGEHRDFIERVAMDLEGRLGKCACFYDKYYEAMLARPNLDLLLQDVYSNRSDLVVAFVCADYDEKLWCGIEWQKIRERRNIGEDNEIMYVRIAEGNVAGLSALDGYLDAQSRTPEQVAKFIEERVRAGRQ